MEASHESHPGSPAPRSQDWEGLKDWESLKDFKHSQFRLFSLGKSKNYYAINISRYGLRFDIKIELLSAESKAEVRLSFRMSIKN